MAKIGYARASTQDQDLTVQLEKLRDAGCDVVRAEKATGTSRDARPELETLLQFLRDGDELVVTKIDRLARSIADLQDILRTLKAKGVRLKALDQPIDTSSAAGKAFLDMLGVFAEFETNLRKERQADGIARAKTAGVYRGRKPKIDAEAVRRMLADGIGATAIARELGVGRASVYRLANLAGASKQASTAT
jgi:DNA invertase Pin-like site-specific DNA recombinase